MGFSLTVKTLTGKEVQLSVENNDTIESIKEQIEEKEGIPPSQQRLILDGKKLEEEHTVEASGVKEGSVLHLVLTLRGGSI